MPLKLERDSLRRAFKATLTEVRGESYPTAAATSSFPAVSSPQNSGQASPLGATADPKGVNFSLYSRAALGVELLFFEREEDAQPSRVISLDPFTNRTYHYWHVFVPGVQAGQLYG